MEKVKVIEIKKSIFDDNNKMADELRNYLKNNKCLLINLMSSPGAGKTSTLIRIINLLKSKLKIAIMEADIDSDVDTKKIISATGVDAIQLHTGGMCHLDAEMTRQGLDNLDIKKYDLIFLENVGNLVCPAEFDTGANFNMMILSIPEGDDKPLKYPLMFSICDLVVFNKIDTLPYFDFNVEKCEEYVHLRNKNSDILKISAKTGEGCNELSDYIYNKVNNLKGE